MALNDPRQKVALSGMVAALFFSFSYILIGALYFPFAIPELASFAERQLFVWQNLLFAALPLAGGILSATIRTVLRPATLDGEQAIDGSRLDIHKRFVRDTSQFLLLLAITLSNLVNGLQGEFLRVIPVLTSWFIFSRLYYWAAYLIHPPQRIFGTVATLAPLLFFMLLALKNILAAM